MKNLIIAATILLFCIPSMAQIGQYDQVVCSNLVINTGNYQVSSFPEIKWLFLDPGLNTNIMYESVNPAGFVFSHALQVAGNSTLAGSVSIWNLTVTTNLTVNGTINYAGAIVWNTNLVETTNASYVFYPTNSQALAVDMTRAYGDLDSAINYAFTGITGKTTTNYETAVLLLRNTVNWPANTNTLTVTLPANVHSKGALFVTNETAMTWFYNPNVPSTNVICLPIW